MPPKATQGTALSPEQVQLLCQVVQHSEAPKKESWDVIAQKLNISTGSAAQQRFGRLLKALKSTDPSGNSDEGTPKAKATRKRAASGKQNSTNLKKGKANNKHAEDEDEEDEEDELSEEETPSKKRKSGKQSGTPKWKSIFEHEDDEDSDGSAVITKIEEALGGDMVE